MDILMTRWFDDLWEVEGRSPRGREFLQQEWQAGRLAALGVARPAWRFVTEWPDRIEGAAKASGLEVAGESIV